MIIHRNIDGRDVDITLSDNERYDAYAEQQFIFDKMDVEDTIAGCSDAEVKEMYGVSKDKFRTLVEDMAIEMRRNIDKYDMSWDYARDEAIRDVLYRNEET